MRSLFVSATYHAAHLSLAILLAISFSYVGLVQAQEAFINPEANQTEVEQPYDQDVDGQQRAKKAGENLLGQPGPKAVLTTLTGEKIDLTKLYGHKPIYLKFWATWCVPCRAQMPSFQAFQEAHGDEVQVIAVNTGFADTAQAAAGYSKKMSLTMPVSVDDGTLAKVFNLRVTPQHVLIDRSGRIAYVGHSDDQELNNALQKLLTDDGEIAIPVTATNLDPVADEALKLGDTIKQLTVPTLEGKTVDVARTNTDKPLGLVFFAIWCESYLTESKPETAIACRREREAVNKLSQNTDIEWLALASGLWTEQADIDAYLETTEVKVPVALDTDGALFRKFGIQQIPSVVLIDGQGKWTQLIGPQDTHLDKAVNKIFGP